MAPAARNLKDFLKTLDEREGACFCLEPFNEDHVAITMECCKQMVGRKCLEKWVKGRAVNKNKCPNCREELFNRTSTRSPGSRAADAIARTPPSRDRPPPLNFPQSVLRSASSSITPAELSTPPSRVRPLPTNFLQPVPGSAPSPPPHAVPPRMPRHPSLVPEWRFSQDFSANHTSLIQEAQALWDSLISHPRLFNLLWSEMQDRYESMGHSATDPLHPRREVSPTHLSEFVLNIVTDEFTFGDINSHDQPMLRYMHHLQRYPNFIHTEVQEDAILSGRDRESVPEEQFVALLLTKPLLHCVELMARCIQLMRPREPKHVSADVFVQITNYLQNDKPAWQLKVICWGYLFRPTMITQTILRGDSSLPTLRLLTVLLMSSSIDNILRELSLEGDVAASLANNLVRQRYNGLLAEVRDRTRSLREEQLERLAQLPDAALAESWQWVIANSGPRQLV